MAEAATRLSPEEQRQLEEAAARNAELRRAEAARKQDREAGPEPVEDDEGILPWALQGVDQVITCTHCQKPWHRQVQVKVGRPAPTAEPTPCPGCEERIREEAAEEEREASHAAEREKRAAGILDALAAAGVNTREHGHCTLHGWDASEAGEEPRRQVRRLLRDAVEAGPHDPVRGVYLFGLTGCGKSQLAVAALREVMLDPRWDPRTVVYDKAQALIGEIQETYSAGTSSRLILERRKTARLWILDDLGAEQPSDDVIRRLTEILDARALAPTLITGNLTTDELENRHHEMYRIGSRLGPKYFDRREVRGRDRRHDQAAA